MAQKNLIPKSKAKTAYGLLNEVCALILEEPRRFNQEEAYAELTNDDLAPECGTVCCTGGWVLMLKGGNPRHDTLGKAAKILGIDESFMWELFDADKAGSRTNANGQITRASLRAHARRGVAHIKRYMKLHARQLKAKKV